MAISIRLQDPIDTSNLTCWTRMVLQLLPSFQNPSRGEALRAHAYLWVDIPQIWMTTPAVWNRYQNWSFLKWLPTRASHSCTCDITSRLSLLRPKLKEIIKINPVQRIATAAFRIPTVWFPTGTIPNKQVWQDIIPFTWWLASFLNGMKVTSDGWYLLCSINDNLRRKEWISTGNPN